MVDLTTTDELLIVAALSEFHNRHVDADPARANRAHALAREIAASHGLTVADAIRQSRPPRSLGPDIIPDDG